MDQILSAYTAVLLIILEFNCVMRNCGQIIEMSFSKISALLSTFDFTRKQEVGTQNCVHSTKKVGINILYMPECLSFVKNNLASEL